MATRKDYWKKVRDAAIEQLTEMRAERDERASELTELNTEIMQLERLLSSLNPFTSEEPHDDTIRVEGVADLELADAIREVLKQSEQYRTPRGVRDSLKVSEYDLEQHPNALASIHGVLKRLVESGEAEQLEAKGKTYYRWNSERNIFKNAVEQAQRDIAAVLRRPIPQAATDAAAQGLRGVITRPKIQVPLKPTDAQGLIERNKLIRRNKKD